MGNIRSLQSEIFLFRELSVIIRKLFTDGENDMSVKFKIQTTEKKANCDEKCYSLNQLRLCICIVAIVNLVLIIVWIFTERTDSDFISHFSFASTVTSIILSVLAIFMSVSGESKTQAIRDRIEQEADEIIDVTSRLEHQMNDLSGKIEVIAHTTDNINAAVSEHPETPPSSGGWKTAPSSSGNHEQR